MDDLYFLDKELNIIHIIDTHLGVIWANRYNEVGDCELVISASIENLNKLMESKYIERSDDEMVCEIDKIELKTDEENGNKLIITGTDVKNILYQRIVEKQTNFNGLVEDYIRTLVEDAIINPTNPDRKIDNFILGDKAGFAETIKQQVTYANVGEKIEDLCKQLGWGFKVTIDNKKFVFSLFKGEDKTEYVTFSPEYDNISTTDYVQDNKNIKNVALVAGEGEGVNRAVTIIGSGKGIDRHEIYFDEKDTSSVIEYDELTHRYPHGKQVTVEGIIYYQVDGVNIATITKNEEGEVTEVKLCKDVYIESLENIGYEKLSTYKSNTSFTGEVIVGMNYTYKKDYKLGDIVNIINEYEISIHARIAEVIENQEENGYRMEPTFEYIE